MQYRNIVQAFATTPFACMPEKLQEIAQLLELKATGAVLPQAEVAARIGGRREVGAAPVALHQAAGGSSGTGRGATIAVIPIYGVIAQRMGMMSEISGGTSTQRVSADLRQAVADPRVSRIVLDIDSPGGGVYGISELADEIRKSRGPKPIIAQANSLMASAAYWIGSACDELVCTPSGEVGSIGVYGVHEDWSTAYADAGIKFTLVKAGKFKAEGVDFEPLSKEAAGDMQRRVDEYYSMFVRSIARGRGVSVDDVRRGFGEGRVVGAVEAVKLKMADRVATLAETLSRLGSRGGAVSPAGTQHQAFDADHDRRANRNRLRQRGVAV